ncbi:DoxX family protein, partial [Pseudomonas sp. BGM005]|nr:DoxX family protein [Pseudomonas sp. BG5]
MLSSIHLLQPHLLSLQRIISSLVLFSYGTQKILHFPAAASVPPKGSLSRI